jgi:acyl-CoA synthetase (AMP-forming)/AMP-acid ligase II
LIASRCKSFGDSRRRTRDDSNAAPVPIARPRPPHRRRYNAPGLEFTTKLRVAAVIVVDDSASLNLESVREFCRPRIAGFKIPREVFTLVEPLPRTPTGKVQKFKLVERYHPGNRYARQL